MEDQTQVIKDRMDQTRTSLGEKLEALSSQVVSTVQDTTQAVTDTVETVKDAVQDTVGTVTDTVQQTVESVKETFNLSGAVEKRPWLMVGGAVATGFVAGWLLGPRSSGGYAANGHAEPPRPEAPEPARAASADRGRDDESGWFGSIAAQLKSLAVGATTGLLGRMVVSAVPDNLREHVSDVVDQFTTALGGRPLHDPKPEEQPRHEEAAA